MSYCVEADVQNLLLQYKVDGSDPPPSPSQTTAVIADIGFEIDLAFQAAGYVSPIVDSRMLGWLAYLNAEGAAATILKSLFPDMKGPGDTPAYVFWENRYKAGLAGLKDGTRIPDGLPRNGRFVPLSTYLATNPDTDIYLGKNAEPLFSVHDKF